MPPAMPTAHHRYTVRTRIPEQLRVRGFVAWINDALHPDDPKDGASISWHQQYDDASRTCDALNALDRRIEEAAGTAVADMVA